MRSFTKARDPKWYLTHGEAPLLQAIGIHGQYLFVDPRRELVVAWFSSEDAPTNPVWDAHVLASVNRIRASLDGPPFPPHL